MKTQLLLLLSHANMFDDYPDITGSLTQLSHKGDFLASLGNLAWFVITIFKFLWCVALIISVIAFVMAVGSMAVHSDDNPIMKDRAKHDVFASMVSILILGFVGVFYSLILIIL